MRVEAIELVRFQIPLVSPFRTSFGTQTGRDVVLVHVLGDGVEGWGEDAAGDGPDYHYEFAAASHLALRDHLLPRVLSVAGDVTAADVAGVLAPVRGYPMAKCAIEAALLDAECRAACTSLRERLGGTAQAVTVGVAVGIADTDAALVEVVEVYVAAGYRRIKLKVEPGRDLDAVRAVRRAVGPGMMLQVDANGAYTLADAPHLAAFDDLDLLMIEQPLAPDDVQGHVELAQRLRTPVCLDESIVSVQAAQEAIEMGACGVVNLKPARVGGLLEAVRIHDLCVQRGIPVWCGGMLETGIGRAANLALASLPGFTLPGDLSASERYYRPDVTEPFVLDAATGTIAVPDGPGIGVAPDPAVLRSLGATTERFTPT